MRPGEFEFSEFVYRGFVVVLVGNETNVMSAEVGRSELPGLSDENVESTVSQQISL